MKIKLIFTMLIMVLSFAVNGQKNDIVEASSGDNINELVSEGRRYLFSDFTQGTVYYKNGTSTRAMLNYDIFLGEMQFVNLLTYKLMALSELSEISYVVVAGKHFIQFKGGEFVEVLVGGDVRLAVRRKGSAISLAQTGAYGGVDPTASTSGYRSTSSEIGGSSTKLTLKENIKISVDYFYYLVKSDDKFKKVNGLRTYLKEYPKDKADAIQRYAKENSIQFSSEADLVKLTEYCNQL